MKGEKQNMNKFLTKVAKAFIGLSMAIGVGVAISSGSKNPQGVRADEENTYTFTSKAWADSTNSWTSNKDGGQMNNGYVQVSTGSSGAAATTKSNFSNVSNVTITYHTNASSGAGSIAVKIGDGTATSMSITKTGGTTDRTLSFDISPAQTGVVKFTVTCSTNSIFILSAKITHGGSSGAPAGAATSSDFSTSKEYFLRGVNNTQFYYLNGISSFNTDLSWGTMSTDKASSHRFTLTGSTSATSTQITASTVINDQTYYLAPSNAAKKFRLSSTSTNLLLKSDGSLHNTVDSMNLRFNYSGGSGGFRWYTDTTAADCYLVEAPSLSSISVKTAPTTVYSAGEFFNPAGLVITATYSDSSTVDIAYNNTTSSQFTFTPSTSTALTASDKTVSISWGGKSTSQAITVNVVRTLTSITLSGDYPDEFAKNDTFSYTGLIVTAHFSDSADDTVSPTSVSSPNMTTAGEKTVTVSYTENNITKEAEYTITVLPAVDSVELSESAASVNIDSTLELSVTVTADAGATYSISWESSATNVATVAAKQDEETTGVITPLAAGVTTITVSAGGQSDTCTVTVNDPTLLVDTLNRETTGIDSGTTSYSSWSGKTVTTSSAVYAGNSAGGNNSIQMRSDNSNSGLVSTASGGIVSKIELTFHGSTSNGRVANVYGSTEAYSVPSELYDEDTDGDLIGTASKSSTTVNFTINFDLDDGYRYIGIRSASGALYLSEVKVYWKQTADPTVIIKDAQSTNITSATLNKFTNSADFSVSAEASNFGGTLTYTWSAATANVVSLTANGASCTIDIIATATTSTAVQCRVQGSTSGDVTASFTVSITKYEGSSISWNASDMAVFSGESLTSSIDSIWEAQATMTDSSVVNLTCNSGSGDNHYTLKLDDNVITLPHTWSASEDGGELSIEYMGASSTSVTISVVQSLRPVNGSTDVEWSHTVTKTTWEAAGSKTISGRQWTMSGTGGSYFGYDATKGQQFGSGGNPYTSLTLESNAFSGEIKSVTVYTSGASSVVGNVIVSVGGVDYGTAQTISDSNKAYTFNKGGESGEIDITWTQTSSKALYVKEIVVVYVLSGNIANFGEYSEGQEAVIKFAKSFNSEMDNTENCTTGLSAAWSAASSAWTTFTTDIAALDDYEEAYAKNLIKYATAQWTEDTDDDYSYCLERAMATYEKCVSVHGMSAFMDSVREVNGVRFNALSLVANSSTNTVAIIVIISMVSMTAIGGYFFLRKRKEN